MGLQRTTDESAAGPRRIAFRGRLIEVVNQERRLKSGKIIDMEFAERSPGVRVIVTDGRRILLTREWRDELQEWDYRLPGGKVFDRLDDYIATRDNDADMSAAIRAAASRELSEETRLAVADDDLKFVHTSVAGATIVWNLHFFVARVESGLTSSPPKLTKEGELIGREVLSPDQVLELFVKGAMAEERSAALLMRLMMSADGAGFGLPAAPRVTWTR